MNSLDLNRKYEITISSFKNVYNYLEDEAALNIINVGDAR